MTSTDQQPERYSPLTYYQRKRRVIVAAAVFSLLLGPPAVLYENTPQPHFLDAVTVLGFGVLMLAWCSYDSLERNKPLSSAFRLLLVCFGAVVFVAYLLKSRGMKKGMVAVGAALLLLFGMLVLGGISAGLFSVLYGA